MMMMDRPDWRDGPIEFRIAVCRALLVAMAQAWPEQRQAAVGAKHVDEDERGEDRGGERYGEGVAHVAGQTTLPSSKSFSPGHPHFVQRTSA